MVFTQLERTFDGEETRQWLAERWHHSIFYIAAYILFLYVGKSYMQSKKPMNLRTALIAWNGALALFSIIGTARIMPDFLGTWMKEGFRNSYCHMNSSYYEGVNGFWVYMFHLSKLFELGDTVFLVLRKRPVIFLHWYHHASVLLYTWLTYPMDTAPLRWGVGMNFTVHAVMYTYYTLRAAGYTFPKWLPPIITSMQILQFVVGTWVTFDSFYLSLHGACEINKWSAIFSLLMYVSYLVLFVNFFYHAYIKKGKKRVE